MLSVLVLFAVAVISEAGVIRQPNVGYGLNYQSKSHRVVRPSLIRSHIALPVGLGTALNQPGPAFTSTLFTSPLVLNSKSFSQAPLTPLISVQGAHAANSLRAIAPAFTTHISPPLIISTGSLIPTLTSSPVVLNPARTSGIVPSITHITPAPTVLNPKSSDSNVATIPNYKFVHEVEEIQEIPEKSVSYSISENDYQYLKRHKTEGQDSPYNPVHGQDTASPTEKHHNPHIHHGKGKDGPKKPLESENLLKRSAASISENSYEGILNFESSLVTVPEPVVTKHIYFHVPPPDFEEPSIPIIQSIPPRKKTYNIVFIKAPAPQQNNAAYLQQILQSRQSQIEDKTLIYVLSKKQDSPQPVVIPPQKTSSPEVYFVKYRTKAGDSTEISKEIIDESIIDNVTPILDQNR